MKKTWYTMLLSGAAVAAALLASSCSRKGTVDISLVEDIPTVQAFKADALPKADIDRIVKAGINAQSAMNGQPWHFSVLTDQDVLKDISDKMKEDMAKMMAAKAPPGAEGKKPPQGGMAAKAGMGDSPVAVIVSAKDGSEYDAGLATQMMAVEAVLLGYGTKIISSPTIVLNGEARESYKQLLGIPDGMSVKGVLLVGSCDLAAADAVSGATPRKDTKEVVTFVGK